VSLDDSIVLPNLPGTLADLDWAAHEWAGLAYYWLRGWTSAPFPAPAGDGALGVSPPDAGNAAGKSST